MGATALCIKPKEALWYGVVFGVGFVVGQYTVYITMDLLRYLAVIFLRSA